MAESFQPDPHVTEIAHAYSLDALDLASNNFGINLDWSESSVERVEDMLGRLHKEMAKASPPDSTVWVFAKAFGSYVGEVMIRQHGGEWGMVTIGDESFPGVQLPGELLCWPWGRAYNRIINGGEDNIWHYYRRLVARSEDQASN